MTARMSASAWREKVTGELSEADFMGRVIDYARLRGWLVHHDRPARFADGRIRTHIQGDPGFPDLVLARDGEVVFAEIKTSRGRLGYPQKVWQKAICPLTKPDHVPSVVWRPKDWAEIVEVLR